MLTSVLCKFVHDEDGATSIEYALIACIVSLVIIGGLTGVRTVLIGTSNSVVAGFGEATP